METIWQQRRVADVHSKRAGIEAAARERVFLLRGDVKILLSIEINRPEFADCVAGVCLGTEDRVANPERLRAMWVVCAHKKALVVTLGLAAIASEIHFSRECLQVVFHVSHCTPKLLSVKSGGPKVRLASLQLSIQSMSALDHSHRFKLAPGTAGESRKQEAQANIPPKRNRIAPI